MQILKLGIIEEGIRTLLAMLCQLIYPLISWLYTLFMNISKVNILSSDEVQPIYQRVTLIITIVMVFYVTFEFVKYIVQPDGITDKEKGASKIVYKMIMVVVLIAFVPTIFTWAFKLQTAIVDKGIIGKVIVGQKGNDPSKFGSSFSANIFSMFYYVEDEFKEEKCGDMTCEQLVAMNLSVLSNTGKLTYLTKDLNATKKNVATAIEGDKAEVALIEFTLNGFLAVIVGGIIAYIMALYCVDVGVRWAQMIFLQIIAPIPIIGYLSPKKDGIFQKWCKQCLTTYLDLFIRIAVIYFILLICSILLESRLTGNLLEGIEANGLMTTFIYIALILGVMLFAKKAPKMLQELFPSMGAASGNFGLKAGERVPAMAARTLGAALGGTRAIGGLVARAHRRHLRNKANDAKPFDPEHKKNRQTLRQRQAAAKRAEQIEQQKTKASEKLRKAVAERKKAQEEAGANYKNNKKWQEADANVKRIAKEEAQKLDSIRMKDKEYAAKRASTAAKREEMFKKLGIQSVNDPNLSDEQRKIRQSENAQKIKEFQEKGVAAKEELQALNKKAETMQLTAEEIAKKTELEETTSQYNMLEEMQKDASSLTTKMQEISNVEESVKKLQQAEEQVIEDQHKKYGSVIGAGLWGAVAGGVTGAVAGAKAKELKDIIPKATDGWKKDIKNIQQISSYEDNGGAIGIKGFADRTVAQIEKNVIGIDTSYQRINLETQKIDNEIKTLDSSIARVDNVKKEFDATEDRIKSKLDDNKVKAKNGPKVLKTKSGTTVYVTADENYGDINRLYRAKALNAKAVSEAASKEAEEKSAKLGVNKDSIIAKYAKYNGEDLSDAELQEYKLYREYIQAQKNADEKAAESVKADRDAKDIEKLTTRAIFTEMLNDPGFESRADYYDGVAIQSLTRDYNEIRIANQDNKLREMMQEQLKSNPDAYTAFVNCKFKDYDQMDAVLVALNNARNELAIKKQSQQDQKNRITSSDETKAKKAADDFAGSGK